MLPVTTITAAVANQVGPTVKLDDVAYLTVQAKFVYGSGGTNTTAWLQTSLDNGATWIDIAGFQFTTATATKVYSLGRTPVTTAYTPTDGTISANTAKDGILGSQYRVKYTTTGTYGGSTTLQVDVVAGR